MMAGDDPGSESEEFLMDTMEAQGSAAVERRQVPPADDWDANSPMDPQHVADCLRALAFAEECGFWYGVRRWLQSRVFVRVERFADEKTLHHLASVRERLAAAEEYERIHGKDALLVKEHPWNIRNAEMLPRLRERWIQKRDVADQPPAT
jgi:hypothetical protein